MGQWAEQHNSGGDLASQSPDSTRPLSTFPKVLRTKVTWASEEPSRSHSAMLGLSSLAQVSQNPGAQISIGLCLHHSHPWSV